MIKHTHCQHLSACLCRYQFAYHFLLTLKQGERVPIGAWAQVGREGVSAPSLDWARDVGKSDDPTGAGSDGRGVDGRSRRTLALSEAPPALVRHYLETKNSCEVLNCVRNISSTTYWGVGLRSPPQDEGSSLPRPRRLPSQASAMLADQTSQNYSSSAANSTVPGEEAINI